MVRHVSYFTSTDTRLAGAESMKSRISTKSYESRSSFVGGSDARIIMSNDEAALVRLWREKRGYVKPEDLSGNLIVQLGRATEELNRSWYERNSGRQVRDVQRRVRHSAIPLDGSDPGWDCGRHGSRVRGQVYAALVILRRGSGRKIQGPGPAQHVGDPFADLGALHHYRWREMGRDRHSDGPALSRRSGVGGKEVLALRPIGRGPAPRHGRAAKAAHRSDPHRRYELVELLGGVRSALLQHPGGLSRPRAGEERAKGSDAGGCQGGDRARGAREAFQVRGSQLRRPNDGGGSF